MKEAIEKILREHGTQLLVVTSGFVEQQTRGFFQAVNSKSWQSMEMEATLLGELSRGQYLYLGPAEVSVSEGDEIHLGGRKFLVRRAEACYYRDAAVYRWALCVERSVNDTWGIPS